MSTSTPILQSIEQVRAAITGEALPETAATPQAPASAAAETPVADQPQLYRSRKSTRKGRAQKGEIVDAQTYLRNITGR
jgi:hypothetical protein